VYVPCEQCHGKRYNRETLEVRFKGKTIADVLEMPIEEALEFFAHIPKIRRRVEALVDVGLGYMRLGQPATTLSGGEAQRVKLAAELSKVATGRTMYILDEPTTGLHFADIQRLLEVLQRLVDAGNSVIVIEHNLDVIKVSDRLIDLGPEGGDEGGRVIATGTPEDVASEAGSHTGEFLADLLPLKASRRRRPVTRARVQPTKNGGRTATKSTNGAGANGSKSTAKNSANGSKSTAKNSAKRGSGGGPKRRTASTAGR
jgi:excinuclease ABC subunit A